MLHTALVLLSLYAPQDREDYERRRADLEREFKQTMTELQAKFHAQMEALEQEAARAKGHEEKPGPKGDLAREVQALRAEVKELRAVVETLKRGGGEGPKEEPNLHHMRERILNALKNAEGDAAVDLKQKLEKVENALRENPEGRGDDKKRFDEGRARVMAEIEALRAKMKEAEGADKDEIESRIRELKKKLGGDKQPLKKEGLNPDAIRREIEELHGALENAEGEKADRIEERLHELKRVLDKMEKPRKKEPDHVQFDVQRLFNLAAMKAAETRRATDLIQKAIEAKPKPRRRVI